jgi:putative hydrolase
LNQPGGSTDPFQRLLNDLMSVLGAAPGDAWLQSARTVALQVATDGAAEPNPDPLVRIHLEELARVAELHVDQATGLGPSAGRISVAPVGRGAWAMKALEAYTPVLRQLVAAGGAAAPDLSALFGGDPGDDPGTEDPGEILGRFAATLGPLMAGLQFGSTLGHLSRRALGQYALPLPWPPADELLLVPENVAAFAEDWSLPTEEAELFVLVRELTSHVVLSRPHVAARITELLSAVSAGAAALSAGLSQRLSEEAADPEALQSLLGDPESLMADLLTPGQRDVSDGLTALAAAIGGYVDHVTTSVAGRLTGSSATLTEAWYRYRVAESTGEQAAAALFGLDLGRAQVDRGAAFVRGVVERAGEEGLARLFTEEDTLPTPAEVDAPGLWLERIDLPREPGPA